MLLRPSVIGILTATLLGQVLAKGGPDNSSKGKGSDDSSKGKGSGSDDTRPDDKGGLASASVVPGHFNVTINGQTYAGEDFKLDKQSIPLSQMIVVRGVNVGFDYDPKSLSVYNYTFTGSTNPDRLVNESTVVFYSKTTNLTSAQTSNPTLNKLELKDDTLTMLIQTSTGKYKVQANDNVDGGTMQTEMEFNVGPVEITHKLGPKVFYFVNEYTGKINFGNGIDADASHKMLLGKDSPEAAVKTFQNGTVSKWAVQPGGRVGSVFGEDAVEVGVNGTSSSCTSSCQNEEQIHGSYSAAPNPSSPSAIPGKRSFSRVFRI